MAKYYHYDVARWEGEGGTPIENLEFRSATQSIRDRKILTEWQIVCGIAIVMASALYARQKGWI